MDPQPSSVLGICPVIRTIDNQIYKLAVEGIFGENFPSLASHVVVPMFPRNSKQALSSPLNISPLSPPLQSIGFYSSSFYLVCFPYIQFLSIVNLSHSLGLEFLSLPHYSDSLFSLTSSTLLGQAIIFSCKCGCSQATCQFLQWLFIIYRMKGFLMIQHLL
jgi:hypothetical protein